jgi:hypothetical protein
MSDESRNVIEKATCLALFDDDIVLDISPCEYVCHHGYRYQIPAIRAQLFFRTTRVDFASFLIVFFLRFTYSRGARAALEQRDTLLARYVGVILGEKEQANDE